MSVEDIMTPASIELGPNAPKSIGKAEAWIINHEIAHIGSTLPFFGRFLPNSLLIHIDGGAFVSNSSVWYYDGERIDYIDHSWSKLKDVVNNFNANPLVFAILGEPEINHVSVPGKLMGYASFGEAKPEMTRWLRENNYFLEYDGNNMELLEIINHKFGTSFSRFNTKNRIMMDIAACLQAEFERKIIDFIQQYHDSTNAKNLYYSGGAALNIKTNARIENECGFENVFIPPCCNDSGLSLGASYYYLFSNRIAFNKISPFQNKMGSKPLPKKYSFNINTVINRIMKGDVLGVFLGYGETGPRALGHRSIIARPDIPALSKKVSEVIKGREWYRPLAPIIADYIALEILAEDVSRSKLAGFMLGAYHLKDRYAQDFKGVVHIDGTLRPQVIHKNDGETRFLYTVLRQLDKQYGIKGLINTSFNKKGKPMVQTAEHAVNDGRSMGLDGVICIDRFIDFKQT
jgi:carbamoyltransferase